MRARDQIRVADVAQRAFKRPFDAHGCKTGGHVTRPLQTAAPGGGKAGLQRGVVSVKTQADDVHRFAGKADRDFCAAQVVHAQRQRGVAGALLAAEFVVVGQRPQLHAFGMRTRSQVFWRQRAVGDIAVAVEVGVGQMHR